MVGDPLEEQTGGFSAKETQAPSASINSRIRPGVTELSYRRGSAPHVTQSAANLHRDDSASMRAGKKSPPAIEAPRSRRLGARPTTTCFRTSPSSHPGFGSDACLSARRPARRRFLNMLLSWNGMQ